MFKFFLILMLCLFTACKNEGNTTQQKKVVTISSGQAHNFILQQIGNSSFHLIDVRTSDEFISGHIQDARNIDWLDESQHEQFLKIPKNHSILLYCQSGKRSYNTAQFLNKNGYTSVYNIKGGVIDWNNTIKSYVPSPKNEVSY